jgi:hypothetical protein
MPKYLNYFPQPFLDDLVKGRCIPFIGAGFSKNADIPNGMKMPLWDELGRELAKQIPYYDYINAMDAISAFEHEYSRAKLVEQLSDLLLVNYVKPGITHKAFCALPFDIVCTTNLEFLLERGYESIHRYCCPIVEEDRLSVTTNGPGVNLLKIHGDIHHPKHLVVTEDDYDLFIERNPLFATFISNLLILRTALFIGYSLEDPDFRHLWQVVGERLGKLRRAAYALVVNAKPHFISRFERRGVKVINLPGKESDYPIILEEAFRELKEFWEKKLIENSTVTEEEPLKELSLPKDAKNRLCFLAIPFQLLSFYKSMVFPIIQDYGFTPITAEEVLSEGDTIFAKVSALISRSEIIVVDVSSSYTLNELKLVLSKNYISLQNVLIIKEEGSELVLPESNYIFITRPKQPHLYADNFLEEINHWFSNISEVLKPIYNEEPKRLMEKKEYRAAVISAITLLENELKAYLKINKYDNKNYRQSISQLLENAIQSEILSKDKVGQLRNWLNIRNSMVHSNEIITGSQARNIVNGVYNIVKDLRYRDN